MLLGGEFEYHHYCEPFAETEREDVRVVFARDVEGFDEAMHAKRIVNNDDRIEMNE